MRRRACIFLLTLCGTLLSTCCGSQIKLLEPLPLSFVAEGAQTVLNERAQELNALALGLFGERIQLALPIRLPADPDEFFLPSELLNKLRKNAFDKNAASKIRALLMSILLEYEYGYYSIKKSSRSWMEKHPGEYKEWFDTMQRKYDSWGLFDPHDMQVYAYSLKKLNDRENANKRILEAKNDADFFLRNINLGRKIVNLDRLLVLKNLPPEELTNSNDVLGRVAYGELIFESSRVPSLNKGIERLVTSELYRSPPNEGSSYVFLDYGERLLQGVLEKLKKALPPAARKKVSRYRVTINYPAAMRAANHMTLLGAFVDPASEEVYISPAFARALLAYCHYPNGKIIADIYRLQLTRARAPDLLEFLQRYEDCIFKASALPLAHEIAHVYLSDGRSAVIDESLVDCYALLHADRIAHAPMIGAFQQLLEAAVDQGLGYYWGISDSGILELKDRFNKLRRRQQLLLNQPSIGELLCGVSGARRLTQATERG